ncbi:unnamed protein product [Cuscuta europaea]|uniref:Uncharacterized protein n=1 Tax=Cuscuta europaea TaxID=41803 RepID=A0A9P1DWV9_CUSEU|nr:unnamed protein product [Cuscuta europaea]
MGLTRFMRPKGGCNESSPNLYVANCGPAVGLSLDAIVLVFSKYGDIRGVYPADESGTRVIVSYHDKTSAQSALEALDGHPCPHLGGRCLHIRYSVQSVSKELLAAVDSRPWQNLAKRRVQHYGYEFCYDIRNVNTSHYLGELPQFVSLVLERVSSFQKLGYTGSVVLDQLTVNEYPPGVGLSPHIDTHSAFEGLIFSLSLAGPCVMEFRKYQKGVWVTNSELASHGEMQDCDKMTSSFLRKAIYLPPRSMLLLSGEARYAWHHYIPHHKVDIVKDNTIRRAPRRVSFTLRKVREGLCECNFPAYCDSQKCHAE